MLGTVAGARIARVGRVREGKNWPGNMATIFENRPQRRGSSEPKPAWELRVNGGASVDLGGW